LYWQTANKQCAAMLLRSFEQSSRYAQGSDVVCCLIDCWSPIWIEFQYERKTIIVLIAQSACVSLVPNMKLFQMWEYRCHSRSFDSQDRKMW
jgi:hypothetical protein